MDRQGFAQWTRTRLQQSPSFLNIREIANVGRDSGVLSAAEAAGIERSSRMPPWLLEMLGFSAHFSPSVSFERRIMFEGSAATCAPPRTIGDPVLPESFAKLTGRSPRVSVSWGAAGTFAIQNFLKAGFVADGFIPGFTDELNLWAWELFKQQRPTHLPGRTLLCVVEGSSIYTHWLLDTLPRMHVARQAGFALQDFDHVLLAAAQARFHREGLATIGIEPDQIRLRSTIGPVIRCDEFCLVSNVRDAFFADEWLYEFVTEAFPALPARSAPSRRIYISRAGASRRRLVNENALLPILEEYGFECLRMEDMTIREAATLCADVSHVVAPHGAGLSNLVFVPGGGTVLELFGAHISPEYWRICSARDHRYFCMQGEATDGAPFTAEGVGGMGFFERNGLDFQVPPERLRQALATMCYPDREYPR